ncbi:arylamine N-acetyltransferase [Micromonospora sp. WMMD1082]|uniref:arylamine N-acetyltransferase family protein n=1 Tax=Micromonospora sp. WMMD1082 TaxID=3016104 RepID=UPI002415FFEB|nr:arylamine N-acetyltransferase [Micromonospora sp. WMMD1082]MDG4797619.1 arylamine N-acetyltransferase [Micromonospora sp. WMMD1082]
MTVESRPTVPVPAAEPDDGWQREPLDLPAYLARIGHRARPAVGVATLVALHRAHVAAIPFENLDIPLGRGVSVELAAIQAKLVGRRRGGYCFEHGLLFAAVLDRLGFAVTRLLTRTGDPAVHPRPRSHLVLRVRLGDADWLADPGFGSGLLEPVPLLHNRVHRQGQWRLRTWRGADGGWRLQQRGTAGWETLYTLSAEATYPVDVAGANHLTATSPGSPFVGQPVVVRKDDDQVRRLVGREYTVERADGSTVTRAVADAELGPVLAELGVDLPPADLAVLARSTTHPER